MQVQHKKVPHIPLGDNPSETAGQKILRDAPVVIKLRRQKEYANHQPSLHLIN